jgi:hypothetical protein
MPRREAASASFVEQPAISVRQPTQEAARGMLSNHPYILTDEGEMLRHLTLDPAKDYQGIGRADVSTLS